ncbi:hypothetical protein WN51_13597 [Melipona quadrifasciata]|uniref:Uncharacterized protein n=1 Tax=Melipona quadrifasciata TaxID=166423 RepID=A0A0M9A150_9HYME|nr:hypothetical protein WN51_13597 [Melipona quadrifasciata]
MLAVPFPDKISPYSINGHRDGVESRVLGKERRFQTNFSNPVNNWIISLFLSITAEKPFWRGAIRRDLFVCYYLEQAVERKVFVVGALLRPTSGMEKKRRGREHGRVFNATDATMETPIRDRHNAPLTCLYSCRKWERLGEAGRDTYTGRPCVARKGLSAEIGKVDDVPGTVGDEPRRTNTEKTEEEPRQKKESGRLFLLTARRREPSLTRALTNSIHRLGLSQDLWLSTDGVCYHHERFNCFCGKPSSDRQPGRVRLPVGLIARNTLGTAIYPIYFIAFIGKSCTLQNLTDGAKETGTGNNVDCFAYKVGRIALRLVTRYFAGSPYSLKQGPPQEAIHTSVPTLYRACTEIPTPVFRKVGPTELFRDVTMRVEYEGYDCGRNGIVSVPEEPTKKVLESTKSSSQLNQNSHREETSWWVAEESGHQDTRERDKGVAVAGELACLAGYMAGYLKAAGATCAPTGTPQYHAHGHPAMGVGTHPHPHSHPHPGAPHPGLHSPFALSTHGHPHPHPLEHGLAAFPQGTLQEPTGYVGIASHASPFSHSTTTICCRREIARPLNFLRLSVESARVNRHPLIFIPYRDTIGYQEARQWHRGRCIARQRPSLTVALTPTRQSSILSPDPLVLSSRCPGACPSPSGGHPASPLLSDPVRCTVASVAPRPTEPPRYGS